MQHYHQNLRKYCQGPRLSSQISYKNSSLCFLVNCLITFFFSALVTYNQDFSNEAIRKV